MFTIKHWRTQREPDLKSMMKLTRRLWNRRRRCSRRVMLWWTSYCLRQWGRSTRKSRSNKEPVSSRAHMEDHYYSHNSHKPCLPQCHINHTIWDHLVHPCQEEDPTLTTDQWCHQDQADNSPQVVRDPPSTMVEWDLPMLNTHPINNTHPDNNNNSHSQEDIHNNNKIHSHNSQILHHNNNNNRI